MAEPLSELSGQLAIVVAALLQQFGVPMILRRTTVYPSDRTEPTTVDDDYPCRGVGGVTTRKYGKDDTMSRVLEITISNPGIEPRANDRLLNADGTIAALLRPDTGIIAVRPDLLTTICYLFTLRST